MPYVTVGRDNSGNIEIYCADHGTGSPVVLIQGYPLNGASPSRAARTASCPYRAARTDQKARDQRGEP